MSKLRNRLRGKIEDILIVGMVFKGKKPIEKILDMFGEELKRERAKTLNEVKYWTNGRNVTKEKLRAHLNTLKVKGSQSHVNYMLIT